MFRVDLSIAPADVPDRPLLAVLLDGDSRKSRRTVADRDSLPIEVLKNLMMHWPAVEGVWLPEWLHSREAVLDRLELTIAEVRAADATGEQLARVTSRECRCPRLSRFLPATAICRVRDHLNRDRHSHGL